MKKYQPKEIENKWQQKWQDSGIYQTNPTLDKTFYVLAEYAYPSGDLHVGHWFTWGGADMFARFKRMQGYNVFFPNGFDSFGLPAEGAAIKRNIHPKDWTESNIEKMKIQYGTMGGSFDFYGDLATHKPNYYKWNQWIFLKMLEKGLAYKGKYLSNWCPSCQTVLANEAIENGKCWRCGSEVVQKEIDQWFFKITEYADRLIWPDVPTVDWPKAVREAQNDWIGKSLGTELSFKVSESEIKVFTTRPDTLFGVSFIVINPEHQLLADLTTEEQKSEVLDYVAKAKKKSELERKENKEKTGVFTGSFAKHPLTNEEVPIWIADYVLPGYGTGAVMGVPAHDSRDFEFANLFNLPIKRVITSDSDLPYSGDGLLIDSGDFTGLESATAREKITEQLESKGIGKTEIIYHIHDWSISRQRYWGTPIPIIYCDDCGTVPVPEDQLPVELPYEVDYQPKGKAPLASNEEWLNVKCPKCGRGAKRDAETMDTFVDSSWYFFRYLSPDLETAPFDIDLARKSLPVGIYFGGAEHTLGHTLYSRFFTKFFKDLGLTELDEYALKRVNHGVVLGPDGQRMSKSKGNVVSPDEEVQKYGSDAVRIHVAFFMPYDGVGPWITERIWGPFRFLERIWELSDRVADSLELNNQDLVRMNKTIKKVGEDIDAVKFNTAIAGLMEWLNYLTAKDKISGDEYKTLLILLSPFAPHITEELWEMMGEEYSIHKQSWPEIDSQYLEEENLIMVIQVNGKVRDNITVSKEQSGDEEAVKTIALESEKVKKFLENSNLKKVIFVPGKIVNFVLG